MIGGPVGKDYCELNAMSNDIFEEDECKYFQTFLDGLITVFVLCIY